MIEIFNISGYNVYRKGKRGAEMKKPAAVISALLILLCAFSSCRIKLPVSVSDTSAETAEKTENVTGAPAVTAEAAATVTDPTDDARAAAGDFKITPDKDAGEVFLSDGVYKITSAGAYTLSGSLINGQVLVDAGEEDDVTLILDNASVSSSFSAPILFRCAGSGTVSAESGTYNTVTDARPDDPAKDSESEENHYAAIYAVCDLKINGDGTLIVKSNYDNGIKSKDDLKIKNVTMKVTSVGCALKGNDSVKITGADLILVSASSGGVKTSSSDVSSKGNEKGNVIIESGHIDIYAAQDGISAARNVQIAESGGECAVNIFTSSYAKQGGAAEAGAELYIIIPKGTYSEKNDYYAYFYNDDDTAGVWKKCEYETMIYNGRSASLYGLLVRVPSGYKNILINVLKAGDTPDGKNYTASSGGETLNAAMNGYLISDISSGGITGDWVRLRTDGGSKKTTYSSKGIKAASEIIISGGAVTVYSMDDGLHANQGDKLEDGTEGLGNVTVSGGKLTVTSADDGVHADATLKIDGGYVNIAESHEGLEGNVIEINGGTVYVYGGDDGINACKGKNKTVITINGGYVDVTTPSGDTDGIDSNGDIVMTGGFVIVKGGASNGGVAGSVDTDGRITVSGGTIIALGGICEVPANGSVNTYASNRTAFNAGDYVMRDGGGNEILSFTLKSSYSSCWIASELIELNSSYTVSANGKNVLQWTQTGNIQGYSGGGFGPGGGRPGGRR